MKQNHPFLLDLEKGQKFTCLLPAWRLPAAGRSTRPAGPAHKKVAKRGVQEGNDEFDYILGQDYLAHQDVERNDSVESNGAEYDGIYGLGNSSRKIVSQP